MAEEAEFQANGDYGQEGDQNYEGYDENAEFAGDDGQQANGASESHDGASDNKKENDDERKLFVGGLSWETTQKDLKEYFCKYGEITEVNIKTDPNTGRSRGFAFIQFADKDAVDQVLNAGQHTVNGKQVDPKRAKARPGIKKIFVGGLDPDLPESDIRSYFDKFGKIEEIELPFDKQKNQRRQFCFITFESEEVVDEICKNPKQKIGNKECDVKKATPKQDPRSARGGWGGYGGGGGFGGGFGGRGGQQPASYGKSRRGGGSSHGYHPYGR